MDEYTDNYSEPYTYSEQAALIPSQTLFPQLESGFNYTLSAAPVFLNGMKVIFDKAAPLYPVNLKKKNEEMNDES